MSLILLGVLNAQAAGGAAASNVDWLATTTLGANTTSVTLQEGTAGEWSDYEWFTVHYLLPTDMGSGTSGYLQLDINGGENWVVSMLATDSFATSNPRERFWAESQGSVKTNYTGGTNLTGVIELANSTNKRKVATGQSGWATSSTNYVNFFGATARSGYTNLITSVELSTAGTFHTGDRFSIYGWRSV